MSRTPAVEASDVTARTSSTWHVIPSQRNFSGLYGVSCPTSRFCVAVGYKEMLISAGSDTSVPFAEVGVDGKWSVSPIPGPQGMQSGELDGISCPTTSFCVAIGLYVGGSDTGHTPLIESWNGRAWSVMSGPSEPYLYLNGISCPSTSSCLAVGNSLVESWDARRWSVVSSPAPVSGEDVALNSVSCISKSNCFAVGKHAPRCVDNCQTTAIAEHWNGSSWQVAAMPTPSVVNGLNSVDCVTSNFCMAVGSTGLGYMNYSIAPPPLAEVWNGSRWNQVVTPALGTSGNSELSGISCPTSRSCIAVGDDNAGLLIESWNGRFWSVLRAPHAGYDPAAGGEDSLASVGCSSTESCTAVGRYNECTSSLACSDYYSLIEATRQPAKP